MPLNLNAVQPTPVRQSHDEPYHKVTPTPVRADSKPPPQNKKDASSLPELPARVISGLRNGDLEFPINDECKCNDSCRQCDARLFFFEISANAAFISFQNF